ncbi:MAG: Cysteine desulfurase [uncultured Sphingosinicella sp.]|uniref:Cysteine desulfurase n=1 Tax=uncultured Sphingosinicella sp. TaxID=478748 RepID=A0A6J4TU36_9SPHN|nr:aminotransferase class V-fold PLP-dependent enzyme [uncultured Sphingosinicella sp.]CAA9531662.1 MAG: Cysteine desulfurase [uncultured Sphingosinicella sp.]
MGPRIYLDHAATTPIVPEARAEMADALMKWHNPNSPHAEGRASRAALEEARARIKRAFGWNGELIFTSGASEALEIALGRTDRRVLASAVEHEAVFRAAPDARLLPLGPKAQVSLEALDRELRAGPPPLVAIQHVNSETGVGQPVGSYAQAVRAAGGLLLSDCSQSAGKAPLPDADLIVVSAHKLGGPPGIGALLVRDLGMLRAIGGQEFGYRAGTQNVPAALGFAAATEAFQIRKPTRFPDGLPMVGWLDELGHSILDIDYPIGQAGGKWQPASTSFEDAPSHAGWIAALTMPGVSAHAQLIRFDAAGIALSAGSACSSGALKPSRVLSAFGVPDDEAACTIRVSFGWSTTAADIATFFTTWLDMAAGAGVRAA